MGIGTQMKIILREKKMTIKQLSEQSGISINTLYSITKRDSKRADRIILQRIADVLGVHVLDLVGVSQSLASYSLKLSPSDGDPITNVKDAYDTLTDENKSLFLERIGIIRTNQSQDDREGLQTKPKLYVKPKITPTPVPEDGPTKNVIKIAGRDGSFVERQLTDEQVAALKLIIDQLPDADDL